MIKNAASKVLLRECRVSSEGQRRSIGMGRLEIGVDFCNLADRCMTIDSPPSQSTTPVLVTVPAIIVADHLLHPILFLHETRNNSPHAQPRAHSRPTSTDP
jgi:hypothetical protein